MAGTLRKIQPFDGPMTPDPKWERIGLDPVGRQLFREVQKRSKAVPLYDEETGKRVHQRHQNTGQKLYPMNRPELFDLERVFYLHSEGNGNVTKMPYKAPTPEEVREAERQGKVTAMKDRLAEVFVDAEVSPEDLLEFLRERPYTPQSEVEAAAADQDEPDDDDSPFIDSTARRAQAEAEATAEAEAALPEPGTDEPDNDVEVTDDEPDEPSSTEEDDL